MILHRLNRRSLRARLISFAFLYCLFSFSSYAQTIFTGPANGDWFIAGNWSNGLPAVGNDATIPGPASVNISQPLVINFGVQAFGTITNSNTLEIAKNLISGGLLTNVFTGVITIDANIQLQASGGITNSGTITNKGVVNVNTVSFINNAGAVANNSGNWVQSSLFTNTGIINNLTSASFTTTNFINNATVNNNSGANWIVDFGGTFLNVSGSLVNNIGQFQNSGTLTNNSTIINTSVFTNNSTQICNGTFNNESGGIISNNAIFNISGKLNNKSGATIQNGNFINVLAGGLISNIAGATFNNNNKITVKLNGTFTNEVNSILSLNNGSSLVDSGYVKNLAGAKIIGTGTITNGKKLDNFGTIESDNGGQIINTDTLINHGYIVTISIITNAGYIFNDSLIRINSGAAFNNIGNIFNDRPGVIDNNFEFSNKTGSTFTNNGTFKNNIRLFNESTFTNNGYLVPAGDFFNRATGKLINTEVVEVMDGSIVNDGTVTNTKSIFNDPCSIITNNVGGNIVNNGRLETSGLIFQRGTLTGNTIVKLSGWIQTSPLSDAKVCVDTIKTGTTPQGDAKVYPQNVLLRVGLDSCNNFQYSIDGTTRRVYTCADAGKVLDAKFILKVRTGDSLTCISKVVVFDGIAPVLSSCPNNATILTTTDSAAYSWNPITATDNCTGPAPVLSTKPSGSKFGLGITEVIITARDTFKNNAECRFKLSLVKVSPTAPCLPSNTTAPTFSNCPQNIVVPSGGFTAAWNEPTASGNCYPIVVTSNFNSGAFFPVGSTNILYSAKDVNNNVGTCSFTITVTASDPCANDNVKPDISGCPRNLFLIANPANNAAVGIWHDPTATDNCGAVTLTGSTVSGTLFSVGTTTVTYTATDAKNNISICKFTVNVANINPCTSTTGPSFTSCPQNITVNTTGNSGQANWIEPTANAICTPVTINSNYFSGSFFSIGATQVNYFASDINGNLGKCTFNVTVNNACLSDTVAPVINNCPVNFSVASTNGTTAIGTWSNPSATDNCSAATLVSNFLSGATFAVGITTVSYSAFDLRGNRSLPSCNFTVTVTANINPCTNDTQAPSFGTTCPVNITVTAATGATSVTANWTVPTATDNCTNPPTVTASNPPGSSFPLGLTIVTYTASDAKNNKSTCIFTVTVNATITGGSCTTYQVQTTNNICGCAKDYKPYILTMASSPTSACPGVLYSPDNITFTKNGDGTASLKGTLRGLTTWELVTVNITYLGETITPPANSPALGLCQTSANSSVSTGWLYYTSMTGTIQFASTGTFTVTQRGPAFQTGMGANQQNTDKSGASGGFTLSNNVQGDFNLVLANPTSCGGTDPCLTDTQAPSFGTSCPANIILTAAPNATSAIATWSSPAATDNCTNPPTVTNTANSGSSFNVGTPTTVTYTATDAKNNKSTCVFSVTVNAYTNPCANDTQAPSFSNTCPSNISVQVVAPTTSSIITWAAPVATDNCTNPPMVTSTANSGSIFNVGPATTVTYTAKDAKNNMSTCSFTVTVTQTTGGCAVFDPAKCYKIINLSSGKAITSNSSNGNSNPIMHLTYTGANLQNWNIVTLSGGYFKFKNAGSGKYMTDNEFWNNSSLYQNDLISSTQQEFKIECTSNGHYLLTHHSSGFKVDAAGANNYSFGTNVILWQTMQTTSQQWDIVEVACNVPVTNTNSSKIFEFDAVSETNRIKLNFMTNTGVNTDYYDFKKLNTISGTFETVEIVNNKIYDKSVQSYSIYDNNPKEGDNFYRIETALNAGERILSDVKKVNFTALKGLGVFPNPTNDYINVNLKDYKGKDVILYLYNQIGVLQVVRQVQNVGGTTPERIDINDFLGGQYLLRVESKGIKDVVKAVIKL